MGLGQMAVAWGTGWSSSQRSMSSSMESEPRSCSGLMVSSGSLLGKTPRRVNSRRSSISSHPIRFEPRKGGR